jgi:hypothetical protein
MLWSTGRKHVLLEVSSDGHALPLSRNLLPGSIVHTALRITVDRLNLCLDYCRVPYYFIQFERGCYTLHPHSNFGIRTDGWRVLCRKKFEQGGDEPGQILY